MTTELRRTPLHAAHKELGAKLIDFGGWDMPVAYQAGTIKEHKAVREALGLFDVSHMGEALLKGPRATEAAQLLATNDVGGVLPGKAVYTLLCLPDGGVVDDCIFYKRSDDDYFVIVNASNTAKDLAWFRDHAGGICDVQDHSDETALVAVQGPKAVGVVSELADTALEALPSFTFTNTTVAGVRCMAARTGYTGEDGFELACNAHHARALWDALLEKATPLGGLPIGLGARDTLRLEAKLPLYGNDLDDEHTPLEAGLAWAVKLGKPHFFGKDALVAQKARGLDRQLVGFVIDHSKERAIARHGYPVKSGGEIVGHVTSGGPGISVPGAIGLAYVPTALAAPGTTLTIDCRGKDVAATVVKGKFYDRKGRK